MDTMIKFDDTNVALATAMSVIRNASVPEGITTPGQPNIAATQWRTMADHKNMVYYFESASSLLVDAAFVSGEVSQYFQPAQPFRFSGGTQ